jgi:uncharacterized protein YfcZ (UPF0381/DUF406 family)
VRHRPRFNSLERSYLAGFRDGARQARIELQDEAEELLARLSAGAREVKAELARLQAIRDTVEESEAGTRLN